MCLSFYEHIPTGTCSCHTAQNALVSLPGNWQTLSSAHASEAEVALKVSKPQEAKLLPLSKFESITMCLGP